MTNPAFRNYPSQPDQPMSKLLRSDNFILRLYLSPIGRNLNMPRRLIYASSYYAPKMMEILFWTFRSREDSNFTYDLTEESYRQMKGWKS